MKRYSSQPELTIVIPAYKEEKRIGRTLDELADFVNADNLLKRLSIEVIVVTADSPDRTQEIVSQKSSKFRDFKLLKPGVRVGKGRDVQYGMLRARGKVVVFMDADLATPLVHLPEFYKALTRNVDVVIATRNLRKHHPSAARRLLSNIGNLLFRVAGGVWIEDSQCGFKMFSAEAARICFSKLTIMGWGFDMEVLAIAKANGLKVESKRVNDWVSVPGGTFIGGAVKNSLTSLKDLVYIFKNRVTFVYKVSSSEK